MNDVLDQAAIDSLRELGEGDAAFFDSVLDLFGRDAPVQIAAIIQGANDSDLSSLRMAAHTLKTTAATVGAVELSGAAERIERAAASGVIGSESVAVLEEAFDRARHALDLERKRQL
jgi:HPt (histidine-containing phosphotransfer) domain-containing protein